MRIDFDVVVIGSGIVGVSCAFHSLLRSLSVALVDDTDSSERTSYGNAGVISRGSILPMAGPSLRKNVVKIALGRSLDARIDWMALPHLKPYLTQFWANCRQDKVEQCASALNPLCAAAWDEHYRVARMLRLTHLLERKGWLKLYRSDKAFAEARADFDILQHYHVDMQVFNTADIKALEPALLPDYAKGVLFPETGFVSDPGALVAGWREGARQRGGRLVASRVHSIKPLEGGVRLHMTNGASLTARHAVVAAGAFSGHLLAPLGYHPPLVAERGYHRHRAYNSEKRLTRPIYDVEKSLILSPMEQGLRVLSGVDLSMPSRPPRFSQINAANQTAPTITPCGPELEHSPWMGLRPSLPDSLPAIGALKGLPNIICAFGHGHMGLSLGPVTGLLVSEIITGLQPSVAMKPFDPNRFEWRI